MISVCYNPAHVCTCKGQGYPAVTCVLPVLPLSGASGHSACDPQGGASFLALLPRRPFCLSDLSVTMELNTHNTNKRGQGDPFIFGVRVGVPSSLWSLVYLPRAPPRFQDSMADVA